MTTNIIFDHRGRTKAGKEGPVEIRVTHNRQSWYVNTGVRVMKAEFKDGEVCRRDDAKELNGMIRGMAARVVDIVGRMIASGETVDGPAIRRRLMSADEAGEADGFIAWCEDQLDGMGLAEGSVKHYRTLLSRLEQWGRMSAWNQLTVENVLAFDCWLHATLKKPLSDAERKAGKVAQPVSDAGVYNYHKCLKALLNRAVLLGRLSVSPYERLKGKFSRGDADTVEFLTEEEMGRVVALHPIEGTPMAAARDLFVFQMETGLSYADTQAFDFSQYQNIDGRWVSIGHRVKNGCPYVSRLSDECLDILGRYGMKLPKMDNADYNKWLKALAVAAGIKKRLHSHMARHSFATYMLAKGARIENVSKMLGHTNITQTQRYAKVLPESVLADYDKVMGAHGGEAGADGLRLSERKA